MSTLTASSDPLSLEVAELLQRTDTLLSSSSAGGRAFSDNGRQSGSSRAGGPGPASRGLMRASSLRSSGGALGTGGGGDALSEAASRLRGSFDTARSKLTMLKKTASFKEPLSVEIPPNSADINADAPTPRFSPRFSPTRPAAPGSVALTDPSMGILDRSASMSLPSPHRMGGGAGGGGDRTYNSFAGLQDMVSMVDEMVSVTAAASAMPMAGGGGGGGAFGRAGGRLGLGLGAGLGAGSTVGGGGRGTIGLGADAKAAAGGLRSTTRFGSPSLSPRSPLRKSPGLIAAAVPTASPGAKGSRRAQLQGLLSRDLAAPYDVVKFKTEAASNQGRSPASLSALAGDLQEKFDRVNRKLKNWELVETAATERFNNAMDAALDALFARVNLTWPTGDVPAAAASASAGRPTSTSVPSGRAASSRAAAAGKGAERRSERRPSSNGKEKERERDARGGQGNDRYSKHTGDESSSSPSSSLSGGAEEWGEVSSTTTDPEEEAEQQREEKEEGAQDNSNEGSGGSGRQRRGGSRSRSKRRSSGASSKQIERDADGASRQRRSAHGKESLPTRHGAADCQHSSRHTSSPRGDRSDPRDRHGRSPRASSGSQHAPHDVGVGTFMSVNAGVNGGSYNSGIPLSAPAAPGPSYHHNSFGHAPYLPPSSPSGYGAARVMGSPAATPQGYFAGAGSTSYANTYPGSPSPPHSMVFAPNAGVAGHGQYLTGGGGFASTAPAPPTGQLGVTWRPGGGPQRPQSIVAHMSQPPWQRTLQPQPPQQAGYSMLPYDAGAGGASVSTQQHQQPSAAHWQPQQAGYGMPPLEAGAGGASVSTQQHQQPSAAHWQPQQARYGMPSLEAGAGGASVSTQQHLQYAPVQQYGNSPVTAPSEFYHTHASGTAPPSPAPPPAPVSHSTRPQAHGGNGGAGVGGWTSGYGGSHGSVPPTAALVTAYGGYAASPQSPTTHQHNAVGMGMASPARQFTPGAYTNGQERMTYSQHLRYAYSGR